MKILDVMSSVPTTVFVDDDLDVALRTMLLADIRHLPVLAGGKLAGILSQGDVLRARAIAGGRRLRVSDAMTAPVETVAPGDDVSSAAVRMATLRIGCVVVVDEGDLVGIVTALDLLAQIGLQAEAAVSIGDIGGES